MPAEIATGEHKMRYCGNVRISIVLTPRDQYEVQLSDGEDECSFTLNPPKVITDALDSEDSFDAIARAALAFAIDEVDSIFEGVEANDAGFWIRREDPRG